MKTLPIDIVERYDSMIDTLYLKAERLRLPKPPPAMIPGIEVARIRISLNFRERSDIVSLRHTMMVCGHEAVGHQARVCFQAGFDKAVEAVAQIGFISIHDFVVGGEGKMNGFSHGISCYSFALILFHRSSAAISCHS